MRRGRGRGRGGAGKAMAPAASKLRAGAGVGALPQRALAQYLRLLRLYPVLTKAATRSARSGRGGVGPGGDLRAKGAMRRVRGPPPSQKPCTTRRAQRRRVVYSVLTAHCQGASQRNAPNQGSDPLPWRSSPEGAWDQTRGPPPAHLPLGPAPDGSQAPALAPRCSGRSLERPGRGGRGWHTLS